MAATATPSTGTGPAEARQWSGSAGLLTIPETARRLRCSENHVYRLIASGELACVDIARKGARKPKTRVAEDALTTYIRTNTRAVNNGRSR